MRRFKHQNFNKIESEIQKMFKAHIPDFKTNVKDEYLGIALNVVNGSYKTCRIDYDGTTTNIEHDSLFYPFIQKNHCHHA